MSFLEHEPGGMLKPPESRTFPAMPGSETRTGGWVFYDADCALCAGSASRAEAFLGRHGFVLVPLQTPGTAERVGVAPADLLARVHLLTREGQRFAGADAFVEIAGHIGWARPLAFVAGSPRVLPRLRRIYDWVAANRYCFGEICPLPRRRPAFDWLPLLVLPALALALRSFMANWVFMWAMAFALFAGCKWLTFRQAVANGAMLSADRTLGYLFGWVGMKVDAFADTRPARAVPTSEWLHALGRILAGAALVWGVARTILPFAPLLSGWVAMFGIILLLHFGIFQLLALAWQRFDVAVEPLMRAPLLATSLGDFWGARWNTGFHAVAHEFLFRPLNRFFGRVRNLRSVGRDSVEPTFKRGEANAVSILRKSERRDARCARTAFGGIVGSTESRPTGRFMESLHDFEIAHRDHEPSETRSADSLVRESVELRSRGQSCPRSERRFMERPDLQRMDVSWGHEPVHGDSRSGALQPSVPVRAARCRPLRQAGRLPPQVRLMAKSLPVLGVFLVSGLVHEIAITLPARGGYGLPTAYFLLQGIGLAFERSAVGRRLGLGAGVRGRLFAIAVAAAPAFWLFPPVFVRNVILPMLKAIGAL